MSGRFPSAAVSKILLRVGMPALLLLAVANLGMAMIYPMELEAREGTTWLHVLATKAGVSLYDHARVAFLNTNHGPLDPVLKSGISFALPWLPAHAIARVFVLLFPFGLYLGLSRITERRRLAALALAGGTYLFLLGLLPYNMLIGRSDPVALIFLIVSFEVLSSAVGKHSARPRRAFWYATLGGGLAGLTCLANWRIFPAAGAVGLAFAVESAIANPEARWRAFGRTLGGFSGGAAAALISVIAVVFHGDFATYFLHAFGLFSKSSGWGTFGALRFELFPSELFSWRLLGHAAFLAGAYLAWRMPHPRTSRRAMVVGWFPLFAILWIACAYGYYLNKRAGGIHYFSPFYVVVILWMARAIDFGRLEHRHYREWLIAGAIASTPWLPLGRQVAAMHQNVHEAGDFVRRTRPLSTEGRLYSEELHFFRDKYRGEMVDAGDLVSKVAEREYFGKDFQETVTRNYAALASQPPEYILSTGIVSTQLRALLDSSYSPVEGESASLLANEGSKAQLYRRR